MDCTISDSLIILFNNIIYQFLLVYKSGYVIVRYLRKQRISNSFWWGIIPIIKSKLSWMFRRATKLLGMTSILGVAPVLSVSSSDAPKKTSTYIWGNGYYQARPDSILQFKNFEPKLIKTFTGNKSLKLLRFSEHFEAGIDLKGNLLIWPAKKIDADPQRPGGDNSRDSIKTLESGVVDVRFTRGFVWVLNNKGDVYQWPINKKHKKDGTVQSVFIGEKRHVKPFSGIQQLVTGDDHIVALNNQGEVFAMGDDTLGQCGQPSNGRFSYPPFTPKRETFPQKINLPKIKKIVSGTNHILALDQTGALYGWGSNSNMQLSHEQQFSRLRSPLLCSFTPIKITRNFDNSRIQEMAAGDEFSIVSTKSLLDDSGEVFSFGNNLKGQMAIGKTMHVRDVTKIQGLSNFVMENQAGISERVYIKDMECGKNHCIALLNLGYVMVWGQNQYGQIGNKKRSPVTEPLLLQQFSKKSIVGVFASWNTTGVIIEQQQ